MFWRMFGNHKTVPSECSDMVKARLQKVQFMWANATSGEASSDNAQLQQFVYCCTASGENAK